VVVEGGPEEEGTAGAEPEATEEEEEGDRSE